MCCIDRLNPQHKADISDAVSPATIDVLATYSVSRQLSQGYVHCGQEGVISSHLDVIFLVIGNGLNPGAAEAYTPDTSLSHVSVVSLVKSHGFKCTKFPQSHVPYREW